MPAIHSGRVTLNMLRACTAHYERLMAEGVVQPVALDRTWDAFVCAFEERPSHCFDPRDRLFENQLRTLLYRYENEEGIIK